MATAIVDNSKVVFSNSGAAANLTNSALTEDSLGEICFDVLAASGGGTKTTLYSIDDGNNTSNLPVNNGMTGYNTDLLHKDTALVKEETQAGAKFWIGLDSKVHYDPSGIAAKINALGVGETFTDTFQYTIKMANGTLSVGTLTVQIAGANDGPTISAHTDGSATEDADGSDVDALPDATQTATGTITFDDVDLTDTHTVSDGVADAGNVYGGTLTASITDDATGAGDGTVTWNYQVDNSALQELGATQTATEKFTVTISDGHGGTIDQVITVTLHGINDNPELADVEAGTVNDTTAVDTSFADLTGTLVGTDVDLNDTTLTYAAQGADGLGNIVGAYGTLHVDSNGAWKYTPNAPVIDGLDDGFSDTDVFTVVVTDGHGGTSTATLTVDVNGADEPVTTVSVASPVTGTGDPNDFDNLGIAGQNTVSANSSAHLIYGGTGNDTLNGDTSTTNPDTIYGGSGDDTISAKQGNDTVYGGSGADVIAGNNDNDTIIGGYGADVIDGGNGIDTFRFLDKQDTGDTINGFAVGVGGDKLDFSLLNPTNGAPDLADAAGSFGLFANDGTVHANSISYFQDGLDTTVWVDTDGITSTVEMEITLTNVTAANLVATNFIL